MANSLAFSFYTIRVLRSQKSLLMLLSLLILLLGVSWFLGQTAVIEKEATSAVLMGEVARLLCTISPAFLLSSYLYQLSQTGEMALWLTQPYSRSHFILQNFLIALGLILVTTCVSHLCFLLFLEKITLNWFLSLLFESIIFSTLTLFFTFTLSHFLKTQTMALLIYSLGRLKGLLLSSLSAPWLDYDSTPSFIMKILLGPLPNFSLFAHHINNPASLGSLLSETLLSSSLFLLLTLLSFQRKNL